MKKIFEFQKPRNSHNDCVYVPADQAKQDVDPTRVYIDRSGFPEKFMVSGGVSNHGKTSLHFIEGVKINRYYYINEMLAKMHHEMHALSAGDLQQDGGIMSHCTCNNRLHS